MDHAPLLSIRTETCGTYETPSRPSPDPNETNQIVPANNSMPSIEQQNWKDPSIYKVPAHITNLRLEAYQPQVVSFGPYHHGKDQLLPMDKHKPRALQQFLDRSKKSRKPFLESLRKVEDELKDSYDELDKEWKECTGDKFLELMIMDGCFMLEIMRTTIEEKHGYAPNDPLFSVNRLKYIRSFVTRDMLILENQLPMLVLYELVAIESDYKKRLQVGAGNEITAYVTFLDNIINSEQDVALLHAEGIIQNALGSDKAVAKNSTLCVREFSLHPTNPLTPCKITSISTARKSWNKGRLISTETTSTSPWAILSLIAAIFLFILTIIQTDEEYVFDAWCPQVLLWHLAHPKDGQTPACRGRLQEGPADDEEQRRSRTTWKMWAGQATEENEETIPLARREIIGSAIQETEEMIGWVPKETVPIIRSANELNKTGIQFKTSPPAVSRTSPSEEGSCFAYPYQGCPFSTPKASSRMPSGFDPIFAAKLFNSLCEREDLSFQQQP
ncbi:hypothetical protein NL676_005608 [Syzygium grande]|nr:hypothetical protein NL676_005608 [Syzygium grande]